MLRWMNVLLLSLCACGGVDQASYLRKEAAFLQLGVQLDKEEQEVRRVLAQRGLRVVAQLSHQPLFIAIGAASQDGVHTSVRVITRRGVSIASDGSLDDLFAPSSVELLERFGGAVGAYVLVAETRVRRGHTVGCVALHRVLPNGSVIAAELDVSALGSRACVARLADARGGRLQATIAWPDMHAITTPTLEVELKFAEAPLDQESPLVPLVRVAPQDEWLDRELQRLTEQSLAQAQFSRRHAVGVARAAVALLAGQSSDAQLSAYRNALGRVYPASAESEVMSDTVDHIRRGWLDENTPEKNRAAEELAGEAQAGSDQHAIEPAPLPPELALEQPPGGDPADAEPVPIEELSEGDETVIAPMEP